MDKGNNLTVIGIGRLGLCFSLTLERGGYNVVGCDIFESYVDDINNKVLKSPEKNVEKYLQESNNFIATTDFVSSINHSDIIFVTVRTDSEESGKYDHSQIEAVVDSIVMLGKQVKPKNLVICSNVNPGYSDSVSDRISSLNWTVSYNPECIAQGTILHNQANPDVVMIGEANSDIGQRLEEVYKNITLNSPKICRMNRVEAELSKISLNCFMTVKISFANFVGDLTKKFGANPDKVLNAVGKDSRVGNKYFNYGFGYGGPCFPRDNRAFIYTSSCMGLDATLSRAADLVNKNHLLFQVEDFCKNHSKEEPITFTSVTYKKGINIIEESQQLAFAFELTKRGFTVIINETPDVIQKVRKIYGEVFTYVER